MMDLRERHSRFRSLLGVVPTLALLLIIAVESSAADRRNPSHDQISPYLPEVIDGMRQSEVITREQDDEGPFFVYTDGPRQLTLQVVFFSPIGDFAGELESLHQSLREAASAGEDVMETMHGDYPAYIQPGEIGKVRSRKMEGYEAFLFAENFAVRAIGSGSLSTVDEALGAIDLRGLQTFADRYSHGG